MKRSPLSRSSKPLKRGGALKGKAELMRMKPDEMIDRAKTIGDVVLALGVAGFQGRERRKKRKALARRGARSKREAEALAAFRKAVLERAGYKCERCRKPSHPVYGPRLEAHHRLARSQGGSNDPSNGAALCGGPDGCHARVTDHRAPDWRAWVIQTKPGAKSGKPRGNLS